MKNSKTLFRLSAALIATSLMAADSAHGAVQLLTFAATPVTPGLAEFSWVGEPGNPQNFVAANGSVGNPSGTPPPGLQINTPFAVPGSIAGETTDANGSHFLDVTLALSSNTVAGSGDFLGTNAYVLLNSSLNLAVQQLTPGTFTMTASDGTVLLAGTFSNNTITSPLSSTSSAFQSSTVTYSSGAILSALGVSSLTGSASISMTALGGPVVANYTGSGVGVLGSEPATINPYDANATGIFDVSAIPEPASLSIMVLGGMLGLRRRR